MSIDTIPYAYGSHEIERESARDAYLTITTSDEPCHGCGGKVALWDGESHQDEQGNPVCVDCWYTAHPVSP